MFMWYHRAKIELSPNFSAVIATAIAQFLALQRQIDPTWALEDCTITIVSGTGKTTDMQTRFNDVSFKTKFYDMGSTIFRGVQVQ